MVWVAQGVHLMLYIREYIINEWALPTINNILNSEIFNIQQHVLNCL